MKFTKYGIEYSFLTRDDLEMVRQKRNSPEIRQFMEYREDITPEMQQQWYRSILGGKNSYYVIIFKGEKIGLINEKNIDWENRTAETGLFLWDQKYYSSYLPMLISIGMIEVGFNVLNWNKYYAHILRSNTNAVNYCRRIGYVLCGEQEEVENQLYVLTKESYENSAADLRLLARKLGGEDSLFYLLVEKKDYTNGIAPLIDRLLPSLPADFKSYAVKEGTLFCRSLPPGIAMPE